MRWMWSRSREQARLMEQLSGVLCHPAAFRRWWPIDLATCAAITARASCSGYSLNVLWPRAVVTRYSWHRHCGQWMVRVDGMDGPIVVPYVICQVCTRYSTAIVVSWTRLWRQ